MFLKGRMAIRETAPGPFGGAASRVGGGPPGGAEHRHGLLDGGGVGGGLVVTPAAGEPGEPQRQAGVLLEQAPGGGVVRRQGQLGGEHLHHQVAGFQRRRPGEQGDQAGQLAALGAGPLGPGDLVQVLEPYELFVPYSVIARSL
jgi:hypothetical protein